MRRLTLSALPLLALAGCVAPSRPPEPAAPLPAPRPVPAPAPAPAPPPHSDWRDWPVTPGTWTYRQDERGSIALFGRPGVDADLTLRCDTARRRIYLSQKGAPPAAGAMPMTIRTTSTTRRLSAMPTGGTPAYVAVEFAPGDTLLDAIGYSRGRFVVESTLPTLVVPAWAETLRVVEDCR